VLLAVWWSSFFLMFQLDSTRRIFLKFNTGSFYWNLSRKFMFFLKLYIPLYVEISWMQWIRTTPSTQLSFYIIYIEVQLCRRCCHSFQSLNSCFVKIGQNTGNVREESSVF
jgi:hypothetical protein